jgi:hypothetical protein
LTEGRPGAEVNTTFPVSWIRIKFLVDQARKMGLIKEADLIEGEWQKMALLMNMTPIYHGYYAASYDNLIDEALDSMLEEANPVKYADYAPLTKDYIPCKDNFIQLMTEAWRIKENNQEEYETWKKKILEAFTNMTSLNSPSISELVDIKSKEFSKELDINYL